METRNIKYFIHLYLGCEVERQPFSPNASRYKLDEEELYSIAEFKYWEQIKPILRPLSDMTEEEITDIAADIFLVTPHLIEFSLEEIKDFIVNNEMFVVAAGEDEYEKPPSVSGYEFSPASFFNLTHYLLSKHFDLFGLIESGLAIDKTKPHE